MSNGYMERMLSAVGGNRPGVVAEITETIYNAGSNIENSNMTLLGNHFALMIHLKIKDESILRDLTDRCDKLQQDKDLNIYLFPLEPKEFTPSPEDVIKTKYEISVGGMDREGIVYRTSRLLASLNVNILELSTNVDRSKYHNEPYFNMRMIVEVPREVEGEKLRNDLSKLAHDLQETISLTRCSY
ncbi:MAG: glycine cleavage system protein R [Thermodesulfobacteriota bacterium]